MFEPTPITYSFKNADEKNPIFKGYSTTTSTTVLSQHLSNAHKIERTTALYDEKQKRLADLFFGAKPSKKFKGEEEQLFSNRRFSLWICRDLLPFSLVENEGFKHFWSSVVPKVSIPSRSTLSREALDDNYSCFKTRLINLLEKTPVHGVVAFDGWTDRFKKHSYITYTYHFMHEDWTMKSTVLKTSRFDHPHNFQTLKELFESTMLEYGLSQKKLCAITDNGSNMIKCVKHLNIKRIGCFAHSVNRLIQHDLMSNLLMNNFKSIVEKLKKSQRKLCFKYTELKQKCEDDRQMKLFEIIDEFSRLYDLEQLDNQYVDSDVMENLEKEFEKEVGQNNSNFQGLYSLNPIRWGCLYCTIDCHIKHQSIIRSTLESIEAYELILCKDELTTLNGFSAILEPFNEFTKMIQGVDYPTINLIPVLYTHIEDKLNEIRLFMNDGIVTDAIDILLKKMPERIQLTDEIIAAACIDPTIQKLPIIDRWLIEKDLTRAQLIRKIEEIWNINLPEITVQIQETQVTKKPNSSIGNLIANLMSKHTNPAELHGGSSIESELNALKDINEFGCDTLDFWREKSRIFPNLAAVARVLMGIPISNAKDESSFSISGCLLRDRRARLDPLRAEKILFIHDNFHLLNT